MQKAQFICYNIASHACHGAFHGTIGLSTSNFFFSKNVLLSFRDMRVREPINREVECYLYI